MPTDTRPNSPTPVIRNHRTYYLPGGDLFVQVDSTLFRVHSYFFTRESNLWRNLLGTTARGQTANNPIDLVQQMPSIPTSTAETFANFLWVFYNPQYSIYDGIEEETWHTIHDHALCWQFEEITQLCWREIHKLQGGTEDNYEWYDDLDAWTYYTIYESPEERALRRHIEDDHERS